MNPRLTPMPDAVARRTFTVAEARSAGVSERRLRHRSLRAPHHGVRSTMPAPDSVVARCREALLILPSTAVFSHATALDLLRIDRPIGVRHPDALHVQVPAGTSWPRRPGLRGHSRADPDRPRLRRYGLPVSTPEWVWVELAPELELVELVVLADALMRRRRPLTSPERLRRRVELLPAGRRGVGRLRAALPLIRPRTDSCMETRLRLHIVGSGLPAPVVNGELVDRSGQFLLMPDLVYPSQRVAIEYDGDVHRTDPATWRRDITRRRTLESADWTVLTCVADDIRDPRPFLRHLRTALASR
jgi:hypothetical protein